MTVANAERSFSVLARIKNHKRSTEGQQRLNGLAILCIENVVARTIDFETVTNDFADKKARKASM